MRKITANASQGGFVIYANQTLEINGGVVECNNAGNKPAFQVQKGALVLDGVTVQNNTYKEVIMTNGQTSGEVIVLKNCTLKGRMYFPANSTIVIENCKVYGRVGCICMKSGNLRVRNSEFWMVGADGKMGEEAVGDADWFMYNNGAVFGQACIAIEGLGSAYSSNPLPVVDIDNSNIFHKAQPNVEGTATFDVLCINYNGNKVDDSKILCTHGYTDNVTGHTSTAGPYVHWYTEGTAKDANWIHVEMK